MFDLDIAIYNCIKNTINNTINHWSTVHGVFGFLKFAVIASLSATAMNDFIKIKNGDKNVQKVKR